MESQHDHQKNILLDYIATSVRVYRYSNGLSQDELSKNAGIHPNTLSNLENAKGFNVGTLLAIIDATGLTFNEFFWGIK